MTRFRITASIGLVAVAFAITACSGSSTGATNAPPAATTGAVSSAPASSPAGTTSPSTSSSTGAASSGGGGAEIDACSLLSVSQASSLVGNQYTAATPSTIAPGQDQCDYARADGPDLTVIVYQPSSGVTFEMATSVQSGAGTVTNVSGVGDKAIAGSIELDVAIGDRIIAVEGAGGTLTSDYSRAVAVAKAIIAALPGG
jgi:hypothetical protein